MVNKSEDRLEKRDGEDCEAESRVDIVPDTVRCHLLRQPDSMNQSVLFVLRCEMNLPHASTSNVYQVRKDLQARMQLEHDGAFEVDAKNEGCPWYEQHPAGTGNPSSVTLLKTRALIKVQRD